MAIAAAMGMPSPSRELRRRIGKFIVLNGFAGVMEAARQTGTATGVRDPWAYTVAAFNTNLARLRHLYSLLHWAENSLRSHVDEVLGASLGQEWYRHPKDYLPPEIAARLAQGTDLEPRLARVPSPACPDQWCIQDYADGGAFLRELTFGTVKLITLYLTEQPDSRFLFDAEGSPLRAQHARGLLESANQTRNLVAHSRVVHLDLNEYTKRTRKLNDLLNALGFDLARALYRLEQQHFSVADGYLRGAGTSGIDAVIAAWEGGAATGSGQSS